MKLIFTFLILSFSEVAFSATCNGLCNPLQGVGGVDDLLLKITQGIAYVAFPLLVLAYIYTGFLYVVARGKPEGIKKAHTMFLWTTVAAVLILGAPLIVKVLTSTVDALKG